MISRFDEAARKEDDPAVEKLFKLFPQIGCAELGVDMLSKYGATQVRNILCPHILTPLT